MIEDMMFVDMSNEALHEFYTIIHLRFNNYPDGIEAAYYLSLLLKMKSILVDRGMYY